MPAMLRVKMTEDDMILAAMFVAYLAGCVIAALIVEKWEGM